MEKRKVEDLEPTETVPVDPKRETITFPWGMAIIMGVLMLCIIVCLIVVMILGPVNSTSSSSLISSSAV